MKLLKRKKILVVIILLSVAILHFLLNKCLDKFKKTDSSRPDINLEIVSDYGSRYEDESYNYINIKKSIVNRYKQQMGSYCDASVVQGGYNLEAIKKLSQNYTLHSAIIVTRHGLRTPLVFSEFLFDYNPRDAFMCNITRDEFIEVVLKLENAFRNSPFPELLKDFSWYPEKKSCPTGYLTVKGTEQMFELGLKFGKMYSTLIRKVIPSQKKNKVKKGIDVSKEAVSIDDSYFNLRTTNFERTFQSGTALLAGALKEALSEFLGTDAVNSTTTRSNRQLKNILRQHILIEATESLNLCVGNNYQLSDSEQLPCSCPKVKKLERLVRSSEGTDNFTPEEMKIINRGKVVVIKFFGGSFSLGDAVDSLTSYVCYGKKLPCHANDGGNNQSAFLKTDEDRRAAKKSGKSCLNWSDLALILRAVDTIEAAHLRIKNQLILSCLEVYPLLVDIWDKLFLSTIFKRKDEPKKPVLSIYSGHDTTIIPLLALLGLERDLWWPPFASSLSFELHSQKSKQFYLRLLHNGHDVTSNLTFCSGSHTNRDGLCPFENFSFFVKKQAEEKYFYGRSYAKMCKS